MKFDTIIIGGGLSGLCCGISLAQAGKKVAIAATGQSSLHFFSGSFDMLGYDIQEKEVEHPLEAIAQLPDSHPYRKLDNETLIETATAFSQLLAGAGINVKGSYMANHYRLTPTGLLLWIYLVAQTSSSNRSLLVIELRKDYFCRNRIAYTLRSQFFTIGCITGGGVSRLNHKPRNYSMKQQAVILVMPNQLQEVISMTGS